MFIFKREFHDSGGQFPRTPASQGAQRSTPPVSFIMTQQSCLGPAFLTGDGARLGYEEAQVDWYATMTALEPSGTLQEDTVFPTPLAM